MKEVVSYFETLVRESSYEPYDHIHQHGYWRQLTVRTNRKEDLMVWIVVHPQSMTPQEQEDLKAKVKGHFEPERTKEALARPISSLYIQFMGQKQKGTLFS